MSEFDPTKPALVHDRLNSRWLRWDVRQASTYRYEPVGSVYPEQVSWEGLLLDGWEPIDKTRMR
jgi:hypothetical protein